MKNLLDFKAILWDFDGVLMDSMPIRDKGFELVLSDYPKEQVDALMIYHKANGGLSRYVKFRYFFEDIRKEDVTDDVVLDLAAKFSTIMLSHLINPNLLINDSLNFVRKYYQTIPMHIVSGSDGTELNKICEALDIAKYFKSIEGSPLYKEQLIENLLLRFNLDEKEEVVLIGDSYNDYEAAIKNGIHFCGYNNEKLLTVSNNYQFSFYNL